MSDQSACRCAEPPASHPAEHLAHLLERCARGDEHAFADVLTRCRDRPSPSPTSRLTYVEVADAISALLGTVTSRIRAGLRTMRDTLEVIAPQAS